MTDHFSMLYHNWESLYYVISLLLGSYLKATTYYLLKIGKFEETAGIHFTKGNLPDWDMKYLSKNAYPHCACLHIVLHNTVWIRELLPKQKMA